MIGHISLDTYPVEMCEKLVILEAEWPGGIGELCGVNHNEEAVVLNTCNCMEIYVLALSQHCGVKEVIGWMLKTSGIPVSDPCHIVFFFSTKMICNIYSKSQLVWTLFIGKREIFSQVKQVVKLAKE
ncbi:hypothetical protein N665_1913s0002 [Sinapis alba]|nr:hypothetical protein N665_1913s0002 [Sinapis alba]